MMSAAHCRDITTTTHDVDIYAGFSDLEVYFVTHSKQITFKTSVKTHCKCIMNNNIDKA